MAKAIAVVVNVIFLLVGITFAAVGGVFAIKTAEVVAEVELLDILPIVEIGYGLMVIGIVLFLLSCVGIIGVLGERKKLVSCYLFCLFLVIIATIAVSVVAVIYSSRVTELIDGELTSLWADASEDSRLTLQNELTCCGFSSVDDNPAGDCDVEGSVTTPCRDAAISYIEENVVTIAGVGGGLGVLLICALCSVMYVRSSLGGKEYEDKWTS